MLLHSALSRRPRAYMRTSSLTSRFLCTPLWRRMGGGGNAAAVGDEVVLFGVPSTVQFHVLWWLGRQRDR